jgi:hypothetical protein
MPPTYPQDTVIIHIGKVTRMDDGVEVTDFDVTKVFVETGYPEGSGTYGMRGFNVTWTWDPSTRLLTVSPNNPEKSWIEDNLFHIYFLVESGDLQGEAEEYFWFKTDEEIASSLTQMADDLSLTWVKNNVS